MTSDTANTVEGKMLTAERLKLIKRNLLEYGEEATDELLDHITALQSRLEAAERKGTEPRDDLSWKADYADGENQYHCRCVRCERHFYGNRRVLCIECNATNERIHSLKARVAELEMPVSDEEAERWVVELRQGAPFNADEYDSIADLLVRLSRQSKSNALLSKCEEALKKHLLCNVHRMAHGGGTVHVGVRCDGCDAEAEKLAALVHEPACILSQIEQSKQPEVKAEPRGRLEIDSDVLPGDLCGDCPPVGYPTDKTRCLPCPRRFEVKERK